MYKYNFRCLFPEAILRIFQGFWGQNREEHHLEELMKVCIYGKALLSKACYSGSAFFSTEKGQGIDTAESLHLVEWKMTQVLIQPQALKEVWAVLQVLDKGKW